MGEQGCRYCGKWLKVPDNFSGYVCGKNGKKRKRAYNER